MARRTRRALLGAAILCIAGLLIARGREATSHSVVSSDLGTSISSSTMEAHLDEPGPISVETMVAADWTVPRAGVVDLNAPAAKAEGLGDAPEPIHVFLHVLVHPTRGTFLVDTGARTAALPDGIYARAMHTDRIGVRRSTAAWLATAGRPVSGVLLTHLHVDHVLGATDLADDVPFYVGEGEARARSPTNFVVAPVVDALLERKTPLRELHFERDADGRFDGVLDLFGDGTLFALSVPGHTRGSVAFVARTLNGPVLFTGDACHTRWGWENGVAAGDYSLDRVQAHASLERLRALAARHPTLDVRLGHQER